MLWQEFVARTCDIQCFYMQTSAGQCSEPNLALLRRLVGVIFQNIAIFL